jgi:type II secretory ATPase GspE/PulE/Tfp pilus assembly ATPase PilB-like protein
MWYSIAAIVVVLAITGVILNKLSKKYCLWCRKAFEFYTEPEQVWIGGMLQKDIPLAYMTRRLCQRCGRMQVVRVWPYKPSARELVAYQTSSGENKPKGNNPPDMDGGMPVPTGGPKRPQNPPLVAHAEVPKE